MRINVVKGYFSPFVIDAVLPPAASCATTLQAGMVGHRDHQATEGWVLGVSSEFDEAYTFLNDYDSPDANRGVATTPTAYSQMALGGVHGLALTNPLIVETVQWSATGGANPAPGDLLFAHTDGKLYVARTAAGVTVANEKIIIGIVHAGPFSIGGSSFIRWAPIASKLYTDVGGSGPMENYA